MPLSVRYLGRYINPDIIEDMECFASWRTRG